MISWRLHVSSPAITWTLVTHRGRPVGWPASAARSVVAGSSPAAGRWRRSWPGGWRRRRRRSGRQRPVAVWPRTPWRAGSRWAARPTSAPPRPPPWSSTSCRPRSPADNTDRGRDRQSAIAVASLLSRFVIQELHHYSHKCIQIMLKTSK